MKFLNINSSNESSGQDSKSALIHNVNKLVECFIHSDSSLLAQANTLDTTIAGNALVAATLAERKIDELSDKIRDLEKLAMTDGLTGLMNRRGFEIELNRALSSAKRYDEHGLLIYIDLDGFKQVNDHHGHAAGDEVLRHVGQSLRDNVRDTDYISRLGGDEFAVLMPRTIWKDGYSRANVIAESLNAASTTWQKQAIQIKASLGQQHYRAGDNPGDIMKKADQAMYKTKRARKKNDPIEVKNKSAEEIPRHFQHATP